MHRRWWVSVAAGAMAGLPIAWLLSYAASLPFFLGAFFFALFGLIVGALVFRVAAPGRPYASTHVFSGTTLLVLLIWGLSLAKESADFPHEMAAIAADQSRDLGGRSLSEFKSEFVERVHTFLKDRYPPGGAIGFARWMLASGELKKTDIDLLSRNIQRPQARVWWAVRVVLSAGLLAFGIGSVTLSLRPSPADSNGGAIVSVPPDSLPAGFGSNPTSEAKVRIGHG